MSRLKIRFDIIVMTGVFPIIANTQGLLTRANIDSHLTDNLLIKDVFVVGCTYRLQGSSVWCFEGYDRTQHNKNKA